MSFVCTLKGHFDHTAHILEDRLVAEVATCLHAIGEHARHAAIGDEIGDHAHLGIGMGGDRAVEDEVAQQVEGPLGLLANLLIDHARRRLAQRRDDRLQVPLDKAPELENDNRLDLDIFALHQALERLAEVDDRQARLVELRYFGGLTIDETALVMNVSEATVKRDWLLAKARLRRYLDMESDQEFDD